MDPLQTTGGKDELVISILVYKKVL